MATHQLLHGPQRLAKVRALLGQVHNLRSAVPLQGMLPTDQLAPGVH